MPRVTGIRIMRSSRIRGGDGPLSRYAPTVPGAQSITIRMLLGHRSGLPDYQGLSFDEIYYSFQDPAHFPPDGSVPTWLWGPVWTDGGLMCTAQDTARFTEALLGGRLMSPGSLTLMTSFGPEGYGIGVASKTDGPRPLQGHAGTKPGYDAAAWYDPERRLAIVALTNGVGPNFLAGTVFQRLDEAYARGATP